MLNSASSPDPDGKASKAFRILPALGGRDFSKMADAMLAWDR